MPMQKFLNLIPSVIREARSVLDRDVVSRGEKENGSQISPLVHCAVAADALLRDLCRDRQE